MLQESYYHEDEPCEQDNRYEEESYEDNHQNSRSKCVDDEAEIEINNFKTSFFLECREFIFLYKIVENDEDETECSSWEEIPREVKYTEHFHTLHPTRICWFFDWRCCDFFNRWSYFFDWRFFWSCFLWSSFLCCDCSLLSDGRCFLCYCLFSSNCSCFLWSSFFGSALFWSGICFYHVRNTRQTIS